MKRNPKFLAQEKRDLRSALTISGSAALTLGVALSPSLEAATFNVTNLNDSGAGSLRQAVLDANGAAGADLISFQPGLTGSITLTSGELSLYDSVDIQGPGSSLLTVSGNDASRVFYLYSNSGPIDVTISGLTVTNGSSSYGGGIADYNQHLTLDDVSITNCDASIVGGALAVTGLGSTLTIQSSSLTNNTATYVGGGVLVGHTGGPVTISDTVISGNSVDLLGGGIYFYAPADDVTIQNSTISGNSAGAVGGGIALYASLGGETRISGSTISGNTALAGGGMFLYYVGNALTIENSTISGNQAIEGPGGGIFFYGIYDTTALHHVTIVDNAGNGGDGVFVYGGTLDVDNCIIANGAGTGDDIGTGVEGGDFAISNSLVESTGGASFSDNGGNIFTQDPQLGLLANNGGSTETHLPGPASPAVNTGSSAYTVDQRGVARPFGAAVDMGAVELNPGVVQFTVTAVAVNESDITLTLTVTRTGGSDGPISVDFATANGSAVAPDDFGATNGTLNWANGDSASKTFDITLVNDLIAEPAETFTVSLANALSAVIGANSTVTVTINPSAGPPPVPGVEVPALGLWSRLALMLGTALAACWALGRKLFVVLLFSLLVAGTTREASASENHPASHSKGKVAQISSVSSVPIPTGAPGTMVTIKLTDGTSLNVDSTKLIIADHRTYATGKGHHFAAGKWQSFENLKLGADQPAVVKVRRDPAGNVKRVRVKLYDSVEKANEELTRRK